MEAQLDQGVTRDALLDAALSGDRASFEGIYDRYGDRIHDFCWSMLRDRDAAAVAVRDIFVIAARRLGRLHRHSSLRPWLYAIARRRVLRRLRGRGRLAGGRDVAQVPVLATDGEDPVDKRALRDLVWSAVAELPDQDRALLDLHLRQGLEGAELAGVMGVGTEQAAERLAYVHAEVEWAVRGLLVARLGWRDCEGLATLLGGRNGRLTSGTDERINHHVRRCQGCGQRWLAVVSPCALLSAVPMVAAPAHVRQQVMSRASLPSRRATAGAPALTTADRMLAVSLLMLLGASGFWVGRQLLPSPEPPISGTLAMPPITIETPQPPETPSQPPPPQDEPAPAAGIAAPAEGESQASTGDERSPPPAPVPASLTLSTTNVDLGAERERADITVGNSGKAALEWVASVSVPWLSLEPGSGRVAGGGSTQLGMAADRAALPEGPARVSVGLRTNAGDVEVRVSLVVERPPEVVSTRASPSPLMVEGCEPATASVSAAVNDESGVESVVLRWTDPGGATGEAAMTVDGETWNAVLGPFAEPGTVTWSLAASDARGNTTETAPFEMPVEPCGDEDDEPDGGDSPA